MKKQLLTLMLCASLTAAACGTEVPQTSVSSDETTVSESVENKTSEVSAEPVPASNTDEAKPEEKDLFEAFLNGGASVTIPASFDNRNQSITPVYAVGDVFTIDEISENIKPFIDRMEDAEITEKRYYAELDNEGKKALAVMFEYSGSYDISTELLLIVANDKGALEAKLAIDGWSRKYAYFDVMGVLYDGGSNGAASHSGEVIAPNADFDYTALYNFEEVGAGFEFSADDERSTLVNEINREITGRFAESDVIYKLYFVYDKVGDEVFVSYSCEDPEIASAVEEAASARNLTFDDLEAYKAAVDARVKSLDLYYPEGEAEPVKWIEY